MGRISERIQELAKLSLSLSLTRAVRKCVQVSMECVMCDCVHYSRQARRMVVVDGTQLGVPMLLAPGSEPLLVARALLCLALRRAPSPIGPPMLFCSSTRGSLSGRCLVHLWVGVGDSQRTCNPWGEAATASAAPSRVEPPPPKGEPPPSSPALRLSFPASAFIECELLARPTFTSFDPSCCPS